VFPRRFIFGFFYLPGRPETIGVSAQEGGNRSVKIDHKKVKKLPAVEYILKTCGNKDGAPGVDRQGRYLGTVLRYAASLPTPGSRRTQEMLAEPVVESEVATIVAAAVAELQGASPSSDDADCVTWERGKARLSRVERTFLKVIMRARKTPPPGANKNTTQWIGKLSSHLELMGEIYNATMPDGAEPWADLNIVDKVFNILDKGDKYFKRGVGDDWNPATVRHVVETFGVWAQLRFGFTVRQFSLNRTTGALVTDAAGAAGAVGAGGAAGALGAGVPGVAAGALGAGSAGARGGNAVGGSEEG